MRNNYNLKRINDYIWEIPQNFRQDMRVPARIFASEKILTDILQGHSLEQLINVTSLPGIQKFALAMPDIHEGYGFPVGGVAATSFPDGIISPGGIGYDINCGVRLLKSKLTLKEISPYLKKLAKELFKEIPSGVGKEGSLKLGVNKLDKILNKGVPGIIEEGYGEKKDLSYIESGGVLQNADPSVVSDNAKRRGHNQLGTMGSGNHFVEIDKVDKIFDEPTAKSFDLAVNQIVILIHTGSRGLGHQIATDYIRKMLSVMTKYGISLPDRQLAGAPLSSPEGTSYFNAMAAAANFAWANRQMIAFEIRKAWRDILGDSEELTTLYDVAHNVAKIEKHEIAGRKEKVIVHRKGATRAFGPDHPELFSEFQITGQPVIIPGSMGTASYVLAGESLSMQESFGSSCHGAGRQMSRHEAKKQIQGGNLLNYLEKEGIHVETGSISDLAEEAAFAYKDIDEIVDIVNKIGIAKKVARIKPIVVIKG